jgi:hypothetical protein
MKQPPLPGLLTCFRARCDQTPIGLREIMLMKSNGAGIHPIVSGAGRLATFGAQFPLQQLIKRLAMPSRREGSGMKLLNTVVIVCLLLTLAHGTALARYDAAGNDISGDPGTVTPLGDICGTCLAPDGDVGVDFKGNDLIIYNGTIRIYQSCGEIDAIPLNPPVFGFDVGYDSSRNLYIVSDPGQHVLWTYALDGTQVGSFAAIGNPVGATYDPSRDVYWACDWLSNQVYAVDATSGAIGPVFAAPAGTRIAGTGYDATSDAIVYNARDQATGHWISADDGSLIGSYNVPLGGKNNGQGCGVDPLTTNVWLSHSEQPFVYCILGLGPIAVEPVSWGSIKASYR